MEACMMKPVVKNKPKPPKPPPKPIQLKINVPEKPEKTIPVVPLRPTDAELSHTQYRLRKPATSNNESNGNLKLQDVKENPPETAVVPPRPTQKELKTTARHNEHRKSSRETDQSEAAVDEVDFKQSNPSVLYGMFRQSQKEKTQSFTSYVTDVFDEKEKTDVVAIKQAPSNKPGVLKGVMKGLQFKSSPKTSREPSPDPRAEETSSEKEQLAEKKNLQNNEEPRQDKGGLLAGMFRKKPKESSSSPSMRVSEADSDPEDAEEEEKSSEQTNEKGGVLSSIIKKSNKATDETSAQENLRDHSELSVSSDSLSENKEKGGIFGGMFRKSPKPTDTAKTDLGAESLHGDLSTSSDSLSENKEKGGFFGFLKKTPKAVAEENLSAHTDVSGSSESLSEDSSTKEKKSRDSKLSSSSEGPAENLPKEKGGIFGAIFKKPPKSAEASQSEEDESSDTEVNNENLSENKQEKSAGLFGGRLKKGEKTESQDKEAQRALSASSEELSENNKEKNIFSNMFRKTQKPAEGATAETEVKPDSQLSANSENLADTTGPKEKKGGLAGIFKRSSSLDNLFDEDKNIFSNMFKKAPKPTDGESNTSEDRNLFGSSENLLETNTAKEKTGGFAGIFKKSPKPAPRSVATQDPLSNSQQLSASCDSLTDIEKEDEASDSNDDLSDTTSTTKEKRVGFSAMFRRAPKNTEQQDGEESQPLTGAGLKRKRTIKKKKRVVSFRIKKTLPKTPKQSSDQMPVIEETVELQDLSTPDENTVVVQPVEMAAYPTEENPVETQQENNELMEWWNTVKGWTEWNESSDFQEEDEQAAMEQAADRVYMAARVFVYLFNQKGASLQHRILELLALADAADEFHKKTVTAAVGGGVASVAGSVATITGLILAPFTFGASIIVTAVGIGVATAGSITSATANITDTVHSNMDRKKVEKMIQGYQEEIKDIRKCLEFVQEGMDTLQEWDFDKYSESAAKKALNHNIKHVMKEGGRAGKALMINTDKLISTVQVLGAAGGAAKAAQAISVTTGVMSALFLALDVFFLAKDSHELRKGAKTKFAGKIRQVCKELQEGLLELNKVKTQLQKTMDGIEVEEYEEVKEVEEEVEDDLESDPKKLAELEHEIDILEKKLDKKDDDEQNKSKETSKDIFKIRKKEKGELEEKKEKEKKVETNSITEEKEESMLKSKSENIPDEKSLKTAKDVLLEQSQNGNKKDKETENQKTAGKEKKHEKTKEDTNRVAERKKNKTEKELEETKSSSGDSEKDSSLKPHGEEDKTERKNERRSSREEEGGKRSGRKTETETESRSTRRPSSSWSDRDGEKHERKERKEGRGNHLKEGENDRTERWRGREEEKRGVKDWRAEMTKGRDEKREDRGHTDGRKESHRGHREETTRRREREALTENSREETRTGHFRRGNEEFKETRGDQKRGSRVENARRRFERPAGEEEEEEEERRQKRKERENQRRGGNREHEHTRRGSRGSRSRSDALRENGLCI